MSSKQLFLLFLLPLFFLIGCASSYERMVIKTDPFSAHYKPSDGEVMKPALDELIARAATWGVTVRMDTPPPDVLGQTFRIEKLILISNQYPINGQFEILCHELGHLFHPIMENMYNELFAEVVGWKVAEYYHWDIKRGSAEYVSRFKPALSGLKYLNHDIDRAVKIITGQIPFPNDMVKE